MSIRDTHVIAEMLRLVGPRLSSMRRSALAGSSGAGTGSGGDRPGVRADLSPLGDATPPMYEVRVEPVLECDARHRRARLGARRDDALLQPRVVPAPA